jgi:hypothetical protein
MHLTGSNPVLTTKLNIMAQQKHTQVVDFSNPNADKIKSASTTNNMAQQTAVEYAVDKLQKLIPEGNEFAIGLILECAIIFSLVVLLKKRKDKK